MQLIFLPVILHSYSDPTPSPIPIFEYSVSSDKKKRFKLHDQKNQCGILNNSEQFSPKDLMFLSQTHKTMLIPKSILKTVHTKEMHINTKHSQSVVWLSNQSMRSKGDGGGGEEMTL